ncbi:MAG: hypothetical protein HY777_07405 [Betaproteobacteria bacterium]|nr:hypothetical protein [Betaproteobacteria bacterium]
MKNLLWRFLVALALLSFSIPSQAAKPVELPSDLVDRQLVVLFSATTAGFKAKLLLISKILQQVSLP